MTGAVDANVLVLYVTRDDLPQARAAARLIESGETIAISSIVLCELVWVLRRAYRLTAEEVADTLLEIISSRDVEFDRPAAEAGVDFLRQGGDFADGIIQYDAGRARIRHVATFDRKLAGLLGDAGVVPR